MESAPAPKGAEGGRPLHIPLVNKMRRTVRKVQRRFTSRGIDLDVPPRQRWGRRPVVVERHPTEFFGTSHGPETECLPDAPGSTGECASRREYPEPGDRCDVRRRVRE